MQGQSDAARETSRHDNDAARCPHLVFRNVLGAETVAQLLQHATQRQADFKPAIVRSRQTGQPRVDQRQRDCLYLSDLGPFREKFTALVRAAIPRMVAELKLGNAAIEPRELEICAYRDGGHFGAHIDTNELVDRVRVVSCVYYFAAEPRRFHGGSLRLLGFPAPSAADTAAAPDSVDIAPDTDTLVAFPSWMRHQVLPVSVPSGRWEDCRFTINCWLLRTAGAGVPSGP
jgi:SM-20-related protein